MTVQKNSISLLLLRNLKAVLETPIDENRKSILSNLILYIKSKKEKKQDINLNFICTHNSRRSQFAQVWAQVAAEYYGIKASCYSGGVEVTACNKRTVLSLLRSGFEIITPEENIYNPRHQVSYSKNRDEITLFSKLYNDSINPKTGFAAIMTCSDADHNCPVIIGAEKRISLNYSDPKEFDNTEIEELKYDERSMQIASELFFVFSQVD